MKYLYLILFLFLPFQSLGQEKILNKASKNTFYWIGVNAGKSKISTLDQTSLGVDANILRGLSLFTLRYINSSEYTLFSEPQYSKEFSLLYGLNFKQPMGIASLSAGLSFENGFLRKKINDLGNPSSNQDINYFTTGFPVEAQVLFTPFKNFGFGVKLFGNFNSFNSNVGYLFGIQFGKLN